MHQPTGCGNNAVRESLFSNHPHSKPETRYMCGFPPIWKAALSRDSPATRVQMRKGHCAPNCLANLAVCTANTALATKLPLEQPYTKRLTLLASQTPPTILYLLSFLLRHQQLEARKQKRRRLPEPVLAIATTSLPAKIDGMVFL